MNQTNKVLNAIAEFLFGKKYFANVINTLGTANCELSCFIFETKRDAEIHRQQIASTQSYRWVETVTFRSRHTYIPTQNTTRP